MRIVDVKASYLEVPLAEPGLIHEEAPRERKWGFALVKVLTDDGIVGIGGQRARVGTWGTDWIKHINGLVKPLLVERIVDPFFIEKYATWMRCQNPYYVAPRPSCVEMALWDIAGKAARQPVFKLLGAFQDKVRAYASTWNEYQWTPDQWAGFAVKCREKGFKGIKMYARTGPKIEKDIERVKAVRQAVGDEMEIMLDAETAWSSPPMPSSFQQALKLARACEKYGVLWLEEALPHLLNPELSARLASSVDVQIAGGGKIFGLHNFRMLLEKGALDIVQPDVEAVGGILELKKTALLAESYGRGCVPHCYGPGLMLAATLHVAGSTNISWVEFAYFPPAVSVETRDSILKKPIQIDKDGFLEVPKEPGLGVELNEDAVNQYTVNEPTANVR